MGWTTSVFWQNRRDVMKEVLETSFHVSFSGTQHKHQCIAHCCRGLTLWSVWEHTAIDLKTSDFKTQKYIRCDLLRNYGKHEGWGYKDMDESCGPNYYDCPLKYLEMQPEPSNEYSRQWREEVKAYWAKRNTKLKEGMFVGINNSAIKCVKITRKFYRDWIGETRTGQEFRIQKRNLSGEVFADWPVTS